MGQTVSSVIDNLEGKEQQEKEANDALNALMQVATNRQTLFYDHIRSPDFDPGLVPLSKVIYKYQNIQCGVSNSAEGISQTITDSLGDFINGDVAKGVTSIVSSSLNFLFGNYAANASSTTMYTLTTGSLGGLARIDTDFYSYEYTSETLSSITKNVLVCSIVISSADVTGLDKNDISAIVQTLYSASDPANQVAIRNQLWQAVQESQGGLKAGAPHPLEAATITGPRANVNSKNLAAPVAGRISVAAAPAGEPDSQDITARVTQIYSQLGSGKTGSWQVTLQLLGYITASLGDFEDALGLVDASTVAGALFEVMKGDAKGAASAEQADVVQWLLGGVTFFNQHHALPATKEDVIPLSLPGTRSDGAEKLLALLVASCNVKGNPQSVALFVNNLVARKVVTSTHKAPVANGVVTAPANAVPVFDRR